MAVGGVITGYPAQLHWTWSARSAHSGPSGSRVDCLAFYGFVANRATVAKRIAHPACHDEGELLARAYERLGQEAWSVVEGQFAALLRDHAHDAVVAVTDPAGSVGIHYRARRGGLTFSFALESLLEPRDRDPDRINLNAVALLLCGLGPLPEETYYRDIKRIAPATCTVFRRGGTQSHRYWRPAFARGPLPPARAETAARLASLLVDVCEGYADGVSPAVLLSGGLDSTIVTWALLRARGRTPTALSSLPEDDGENAEEISCARATARHLGIEQHTVSYSVASLFDPDRGLCFGAGYPVYSHHQLAERYRELTRAQGIDTVLTGDGGDHLTCSSLYTLADQLVVGRWIAGYRGARMLARSRGQHVSAILRDAVKLILRAGLPGVSPLAHFPVPFASPRLSTLANEIREAHPWLPSKRSLPGSWLYRARLCNPNIDFLLQARVGMSIASGVAYRHPLLDRRIYDFFARLPIEQIALGEQHKRIFRKMLLGRVPEAVVERPKALAGNLFERALRMRVERLRDLTRNTRMAQAGWIDEIVYRRQVDEWLAHRSAPKPPRLLGMLALEDWLRRYF